MGQKSLQSLQRREMGGWAFIVMTRIVSGELLSSPRFSFSTTSPDFWICGGVGQHCTGDAVDEHGYIEPGHNVPVDERVQKTHKHHFPTT